MTNPIQLKAGDYFVAAELNDDLVKIIQELSGLRPWSNETFTGYRIVVIEEGIGFCGAINRHPATRNKINPIEYIWSHAPEWTVKVSRDSEGYYWCDSKDKCQKIGSNDTFKEWILAQRKTILTRPTEEAKVEDWKPEVGVKCLALRDGKWRNVELLKQRQDTGAWACFQLGSVDHEDGNLFWTGDLKPLPQKSQREIEIERMAELIKHNSYGANETELANCFYNNGLRFVSRDLLREVNEACGCYSWQVDEYIDTLWEKLDLEGES